VAGDDTIVNQDYTRYEEAANRASYIGTDHTLSLRNLMAVSRNFPTVSGNFKGVAKSTLKFTQDIQVAGVDAETTNTSPVIINVGSSIPVGCTAADAMEIRNRVIAAVDHAFMIRLQENLET
jgi:hypothetical protein